MLPNNYTIQKENTNTTELKTYRALLIVSLFLKILSISLIFLPVLYNNLYLILVVGIFIISIIIGFFAKSITKYYEYCYKNDTLTISKIMFNNSKKVLFEDKIKNLHFTKKFASNTIVTTKEQFSAIITNDKNYVMFSPDRYLIGLLENNMREQ